MKSHATSVIEGSHDLDLLDQAFLAFVFAVGSLFRKGFDGIVEPCLYFFGEVDRSEVPLSDFLFGFELFVESSLVETVLESCSPSFEILIRLEIEPDFFLSFFKEDGGRVILKAKLEIEVKRDILFVFV